MTPTSFGEEYGVARYKDLSGQKLRGGYYTPAPIADFLAGYVASGPSSTVLEPSCGDGALIEAVAARLGPSGRIVGVEIYEAEAAKARQRGGQRAEIVSADVFSWFDEARHRGTFDGVIGNPPFIRYQSFPEAYRDDAMALMRSEGLRPNRLTNAWVPFVVLATIALRQGGRLGLVLPAELLQVSYASELRSFLASRFTNLRLLTFRKLIFPGIQQEAVLLLGERSDGTTPRISILELDTADDLATADVEQAPQSTLDLDHAREKWTQYYLSGKELGLIRELEDCGDIPTLRDYGDVNVGIVTGRNEFFVLSPAVAEALGVAEECRPLVGRSAQVPGLALSECDFAQLMSADSKCLLLQLGDVDREDLSKEARSYVEWGESRGFHKGYKCRIRLPRWWNVPYDWTPDAFMLRQISDGPRIVANGASATCTDTIHRVRLTGDVSATDLAALSVNSLTFAFAEIRGRSYGGGVLELEPREAVALPFPAMSEELDLGDLDTWMRERETLAVLDEVDRFALKAMGLTSAEAETLRAIWQRLSQRRRARR